MPRRQTPKLSEALSQYERSRATHCAKYTLLNDHSVLTRFVRGVRDPQVHNLTPETAEAYFVVEAERLGASSYNKDLQRARLFLAFCRRRGWITTDPLSELRPRKVPQKERLRLDVEQMRQLVERTENPRDRAMLACSVNTGLRAGDLSNLLVGDLDLTQGWLHVRIEKTGSTDSLPITQDLDAEMRTWLAWYARRLARTSVSLEPDMRLFPALGARQSVRDERGRPKKYGDPKPHQRMHQPARVVHRALLRIGVEVTSGEGFHTIRRSIGRRVFEMASEQGYDASLRITQAVLGHKSSTTTEIYLGLSAEKLKRDDLLKGRSLLGTPDRSNVVGLNAGRRIGSDVS